MNVSVLVPVYGVEKYIEKCVRSLFSQTMKTGIEFIFVNDCTKDKSIEILESVIKEYPEKKTQIYILHHKQNKGLTEARRTGFNHAKGEYICIVDSDDFIEPDCIELLYTKAIAKNADIVFCSYTEEYENNYSKIVSFPFVDDKVGLVNLSFDKPMFWNKMFKKDIVILNNIPFATGINYGEDLAVTPKIIYYSNSFAFVDKPLYHYAQYNINAYTKEFSEKSLQQTLSVVKLLSDFFEGTPDYDLYEDSILLLKAIRKAKILRSGIIEKQYVELFPEINRSINGLAIDLKTKIILNLAAKKYYLFLKMFVHLLLNRKNQKS